MLAADCNAAAVTNKLARHSSRQKYSRRKSDEMPHVGCRLLADEGRRLFADDEGVASWAVGWFRLDWRAVSNVSARRGPDSTEQAGCDCKSFGEAHRLDPNPIEMLEPKRLRSHMIISSYEQMIAADPYGQQHY